MPSLSLSRLVRLHLAILLISFAFIQPLSAQSAADAFTVRGVEVDVSASNPQAAKDQAIAEGQRQAFRQLLERLTQPADHARLPKTDGVDYVRQFSVDAERSIGNRYRATLTVQFNSAPVRKVLQAAGLSYAEPRSRAVVVVPVFRAGTAKPILWDDPNPWRAVWLSMGGGGLVPLLIPTGDVGDVQAITADQAVAGNLGAMTAIANRWRSQDVMVANAALSANGKTLEIVLNASPGVPKPFDSMTYQINGGESVDAMLLRAARDISRAMDTIHKQPNLLKFDQAGTVPVLAPLTGLEDWLAVRDRLGRVAQVRQWELVSLSRVEAAIVLHIVGEVDGLKSALSAQGLGLEQVDGVWNLRVRGAAR